MIRKLKGGVEDRSMPTNLNLDDIMVDLETPEPKVPQGSGVFDLSVVKIGNDD